MGLVREGDVETNVLTIMAALGIVPNVDTMQLIGVFAQLGYLAMKNVQ